MEFHRRKCLDHGKQMQLLSDSRVYISKLQKFEKFKMFNGSMAGKQFRLMRKNREYGGDSTKTLKERK